MQAQAAELQAKQMQLHRDYMALHLGQPGPDAQMLYHPGQPFGAADMSGKGHQIAPGSSIGDVLRSASAFGSAAGSGASGLSRDSNYSSQYQYSFHPQQPPMAQPMLQHPPPPHGPPFGSLSGGMPPFMGMSQQQQAPPPGSATVSPTVSGMDQQRQAQAMQQPGFVPSQPQGPYGDPLMMVGWQPRPPSFYAPAGDMAPFPAASPTVQVCHTSVQPCSPNRMRWATYVAEPDCASLSARAQCCCGIAIMRCESDVSI